MLKFAAPLLAAVCLIGFASPAKATPYGLAEGMIDGVAGPNPEYGFIGAATVGVSPDWFEGWTFVLENGTNYTGVADNANISDIIHLSSTGADLWSQGFSAAGGGNGSFGATFASIIAYALGLPAGGTVQVVGDPSGTGARRFVNGAGGEIGLVNEGLDGIAHLVDISGFTPGSGGFSGDAIDVQSTADGVVPEPATLTLVGLGGLMAAARRRRKTTV